MTTTQSLLATILISTGLSSCDTQNEKIPSYLYIKKFSFSAKPGEGSARQNLTDGWIYVNGNYYGAYELPTKLPIPILEEGPSEILIIPGYRQDGMITNSFKYSFLKADTSRFSLTPGLTDTINPSTSYQDDLVFSAIEDFDHIHSFILERDMDVDTKVILSNSAEAYEGSNSGLIELTSGHPYISAESSNALIIPQSGDPIILELNFKADIPFSIGFIGYHNNLGSQDDLIDATMLPKKEWTKIYFDFRTIINQSNADYYHLAISANFQKDSSETIQRILIDNIKVIHR